MNQTKNKYGIELIRYVNRLFDNCNETFNQRFTAKQLVKLAEMCSKSDWDILPDKWEENQIIDALLCNKVPNWEMDKDGKVEAKYEIDQS